MNTVTVIINDVEYNLRGKEDEKYLLDVAAYVDTKIKEISGTNKKLSTSSAAVLTAVNIADELFKCDLEIGDITKKKNSLEERHLTLKERLRELKIEIDETTKARTAEVESLKSTISQLEETVKEFEKIKSLNLKLSKKIDEITKSNNDLNAEIEKLTKDKNEEIKTLTESKNQEIEKLTKDKNEEIKTLTEVKNQEIERLTKTNNEEIKTLTESKNQEVEKLTESKNKLETKIKNLTEEINSKIEKEKFNEVLNKLQKTQKINIMLSDENDDLKEKVEIYNIKINDYSSENSKLKENVNTLNESIKCKEAELEEFKELNAKQSLEEKVSLENKISSLEKDLKDALNKKELFKSRNREINFQLQNFKYKVLDLEKKLIDSQFKLAVEKREKNPLLR